VQVPWNSVSPHCNTVGCFIKGLSLAALLQQIQWAAVPGDSVCLHCYSRYSGLQCQGTQSHYIAAAVTVDCSTTELSLCTAIADTICYSTKGLSLMILLLLVHVQQVAVPGDLVCLHCYNRYSRLQYQGTRSHWTATASTVCCSTKRYSLSHTVRASYRL